MRPGEEHGRDYFFVSKAQFEEWIAAGALLEHAVVYGEYKGIPLQQVEEALGRGTDVVMRLDVQVCGVCGGVPVLCWGSGGLASVQGHPAAAACVRLCMPHARMHCSRERTHNCSCSCLTHGFFFCQPTRRVLQRCDGSCLRL